MKITNNNIIVEQDKRPKKITGTKLAGILGKNPYSTPFQIWLDITHTYEFPFEDTIFTLAGKTIEPKQAQYVKNYKFPNLITPQDIYGPDPFQTTYGNFFEDEIFGGMWDYLNIENGKPNAVFEMKTAGVKKAELWAEDIPEYYALQASLYAYLLNVDQVYMVATFLEKRDYFNAENFIPCYNNTWIAPFKVSERYPNFKQDYINPALEWWNKYVVTGISPDFDLSNKDDRKLVEELKTKEGAIILNE